MPSLSASLAVRPEPAPAGERDAAAGGRPRETPGARLRLAELYAEHFDLVWRAMRRYGVPEAERQDALQEVFLVVHAKLASFEARSSVRTWIYGIARRVARDHRPSSRLTVEDPGILAELPDRDPGDPAARAEARDNARLLYLLLAELSPERREIVVLVELEQMTVAEAAEVLDENPNTLQSRLRLARQDLARAHERALARDDWRRQCATMTHR